MSTTEQLRDLVSRVKITGTLALLGLTLEVDENDDGRPQLHLRLDTVKRGHTSLRYDRFQFWRTVTFDELPIEDELPEFLSSEVAEVIAHEAKEGLYLDGVPIEDEHDPRTHKQRRSKAYNDDRRWRGWGLCP